jgi:hypothetical protein
MEHIPSRAKDVDVGEFSTVEDAEQGLAMISQVYNEKKIDGDEKSFTTESFDDGKTFEVWSGGKTELRLRLYIMGRDG